MNTKSASPAELPRPLVWDAPVRLGHWLMVLCFAGAWLTAEGERWRLLHVTLGYTLAGLVAFRLVWGLIGTRHARFASFVRGPRAVAGYVRALVQRRAPHAAGHNPAGALAVLALLAAAGVVTASGWAVYQGLGPDVLEELHEGAANFMLGLVGVHVAAVLLHRLWGGHDLLRPMFNGRAAVLPAQGVRSARPGVAALMLAAVLGFWAWQWQTAPAAPLSAAAQPALAHDADDD